jgi:hypothetical protein
LAVLLFNWIVLMMSPPSNPPRGSSPILIFCTSVWSVRRAWIQACPSAIAPHRGRREGTTALKPGVRPPEEPCLANGRGRQIELESSPPRPPPLRYVGLRGAGSRSQRCRRVTFQLCTNSDISTWLQHHPSYNERTRNFRSALGSGDSDSSFRGTRLNPPTCPRERR